MALFDLLAGALFIAVWMTLGVLPWLAASVLTHGHAGIALLPLCMLAAAAGGMLVPFLGFTDVLGIWLSFAAAVALPAALVAARRFASPAFSVDGGSPDAKASPEPK